MKINLRQTKWALLLGLQVLSGLTAYAYRGSAQWRSHSTKPSGHHTAIVSQPQARDAARLPNKLITLTSAAAVTHSETLRTSEGGGYKVALEPAQNGGSYNITQSVISGGGGTSANGTTNVIGTTGQSAATASSGGNYTVSGGFWQGAASGDCPAITITPGALPNAQLSQPYSQQLSQSGGSAPLNWSISVGSLPNNLALDASTGLLSGTPIVSGSFDFTIKVTNTNGCVGTQPYRLVIGNCPTVTVAPASLGLTTSFTFYSQQLTGGGGALPYSFSVSAGALPVGMTLTASGLLSGAPTVFGTFNFTVRATDINACSGDQAYVLTIASNPGLQFYPLPRPVRILDTRANQGNCDNVSTPINGGSSITTLARLTCEGINIPATAQAITGNVTVLNQTNQIGYMTVYPDGQQAPVTANMIYAPNDILANNFTVGLSSDGKFNIFGERTIHAVIDVSGYYAPPASGGLYYHPLSKPVRLLDTRANQGNCDNVATPISAGTSITTLARTTCEGVIIPTAAQAIVGNATVINGSGQLGYLTIYPNGVAVPLAANLIYFPGQILSNAFAVSLDANGNFNIFGEKTIDIVVDMAGYYSAEASDANGTGLLLTPLTRPLRILDTRANQGNCDNVATPITGGNSIAAAGRLTCESLTIPTAAQAILGNVTVINQTGNLGYLTLYPDGVTQPLAANMIYYPGQILSNAFVVGLNESTGQYRIFAERTLDAILDVSGYFAP